MLVIRIRKDIVYFTANLFYRANYSLKKFKWKLKCAKMYKHSTKDSLFFFSDSTVI